MAGGLPSITRRQFMATAAAAACGGTALARQRPEPTPARLPRWRGFNLLEKFTHHQNQPFREADFDAMADWGFDFARLPLSYWCWSSAENWNELREPALKEIDQAVAFGRQRGIHVCINFHRAPGYCVNPPKEPLDLWTDNKALEACARHWGHFAERYKGIPNSQLSFDLLNEPSTPTAVNYRRVAESLTRAIREKDPGRLIIADGLRWGRQPVPALADLKVAQMTRGYDPMRISHYRASWVRGSDQWPVPTWPLHQSHNDVWDKERLRRECVEPWQALAKTGVGVHVGEWGAFRHTPHAVVLAWMADFLDLWRQAGWGWALWNLRGPFGLLDSERGDVAYESHRGHKLDRKMLELLREPG